MRKAHRQNRTHGLMEKSKLPDALRPKVSEIKFYWLEDSPYLITLFCLELKETCYLPFTSKLPKEPSKFLLPSVQAGA